MTFKSYDEEIEIAPGQFKRLGDCQLADLDGAVAVGEEKMRLLRRRLTLMRRIASAAKREGLDSIPLVPELHAKMVATISGADEERLQDLRLADLRRDVELLEASAAMLATPKGYG